MAFGCGDGEEGRNTRLGIIHSMYLHTRLLKEVALFQQAMDSSRQCVAFDRWNPAAITGWIAIGLKWIEVQAAVS